MEDISREQSRKPNKYDIFVNYISTFSHHSWLSKTKYKLALFASYAKDTAYKLVCCIVTKRLSSHFQTFLTAISPGEKEIVIGLEKDPKEQKHHKNLRNLFTFTIRSTAHRNK